MLNPPINLVRRKERACDDAWIAGFFTIAEVGHLATRWEDQPFITPLIFWYDPQAHEIYFHHAKSRGRLNANLKSYNKVCFEASEVGRLIPADTALAFSMQYQSAVAFGRIRLVEEEDEQRRILYNLIEKYFPGLQPGRDYRPITDGELARTAVYAINIDSWSGKRSWQE
jgi:hypothetical protein